MITVYYTAVDGFMATHRFTTLAEAQKYAHEKTGPSPCLSPYYAISDDGVAKVMVKGCTLWELYPKGY